MRPRRDYQVNYDINSNIFNTSDINTQVMVYEKDDDGEKIGMETTALTVSFCECGIKKIDFVQIS